MFGKRKLLREGVPGEALVIEARQYSGHAAGASAAAGRLQANGYKVMLRVQFPDGDVVEKKVKEKLYGRVDEGSVLPIRYDPEDHSKIAIDVEQQRAVKVAARERSKGIAIARGEKQIASHRAEADAEANASYEP